MVLSVSMVRCFFLCGLNFACADLNVVEFQGLWRYIKDWQEVFRHFDKDRSGSIDGHELAAALSSFGYKFSPQILALIEQKYGEGDLEGGTRAVGTYLHPCSLWARSGWLRPSTRDHLRSLREGLCCGQDFDRSFPNVSRSSPFAPQDTVADDANIRCSADSDRDGWIQINYEQFLKVGLIHLALAPGGSSVLT